MDLKDLFKGVLDDEAIAKIEANGALKTKLQRGDELVTLIDSGTVPPELNNNNGGGLTLTDLTTQLNTAFAGFETRFTPKIDERVKSVVDPLVTKFTEEIANARRDAANSGYVARELVRIEHEHKETFGEPFEETKLNDWVKEQTTAGRSFSNVREAYNEWTRDRALEKKIQAAREEGKRDALSSQTVPGVSPAPATGVRAHLRAFHSGNNTGKTRTEVLDEKLAALDRKTAASAAA